MYIIVSNTFMKSYCHEKAIIAREATLSPERNGESSDTERGFKMATTVHLIFNAHLDPVWLWRWEAGLDAALATFRSACDRLDEYPELTFSAGDAWALMMVEKSDPELFDRIKSHVASGRWSLYGSWWVQPDCNLPTKAGFERQISLGRDYLLSRFGKSSEVARNVDSFGHSAALPQIMHCAGQPNYIMMRPGDSEMKLPARVFNWRGFKDSPSVLSFRIASSYCWGDSSERALTGHLLNSATGLPDGVTDTMCFLGIGDHGGGPTKALVDACIKLKDSIPGIKLEFSTPERYFQTLRKGDLSKVPEVVGELQYHAIGCYTLQRGLKLKLKSAEHLLDCAASLPKEDSERAWQSVCFNQFHDIMGGTCIPSAYVQADAQAGFALALADDALKLDLRRLYPSLPGDARQRIVIHNPSDRPFDGFIEFAPWLDGQVDAFKSGFKLVDEDGSEILSQRTPDPGSFKFPYTLFRLSLGAKATHCVRLVSEAPADAVSWREFSTSSAVNKFGFGLSFGHSPSVSSGSRQLPLPDLHLVEDPTDTWTHNFDRYLEGPAEQPVWNATFLLHSGPLAAAFARTGHLDGQELREDFLLHADSEFYELALKLNWLSKLKVLKLVLPFKEKAVRRLDGTALGRGLERKLDGAELPVCDWMLFELEDGSKVGVVCPDILAADADSRRVRLTLLRSPLMANHLPAQPASMNPSYSDHGVQLFRIGFDHSKDVSAESLEAKALSWLRPPLCGDLTKGMPPKIT